MQTLKRLNTNCNEEQIRTIIHIQGVRKVAVR